MNIAAVIPAFNEEKAIAAVVTDVLPYVDGVLVVDDGSSDHTASVAQSAGATVVQHIQNCGPGAAPMTGFAAARRLGFNVVVTLDADGQMSADDIPAMLEPIRSDRADIAFGNRFGGKNRIPFIRRIYNTIGNTMTYIVTGKWVPDSQSGFKALGPKALSEINLRMSGFEFCTEIVRESVSHRWRTVNVPIKVVYSEYTMAKGQSFSKGVQTALKILLRSFLR